MKRQNGKTYVHPVNVRGNWFLTLNHEHEHELEYDVKSIIAMSDDLVYLDKDSTIVIADCNALKDFDTSTLANDLIHVCLRTIYSIPFEPDEIISIGDRGHVTSFRVKGYVFGALTAMLVRKDTTKKIVSLAKRLSEGSDINVQDILLNRQRHSEIIKDYDNKLIAHRARLIALDTTHVLDENAYRFEWSEVSTSAILTLKQPYQMLMLDSDVKNLTKIPYICNGEAIMHPMFMDVDPVIFLIEMYQAMSASSHEIISKKVGRLIRTYLHNIHPELKKQIAEGDVEYMINGDSQ